MRTDPEQTPPVVRAGIYTRTASNLRAYFVVSVVASRGTPRCLFLVHLLRRALLGLLAHEQDEDEDQPGDLEEDQAPPGAHQETHHNGEDADNECADERGSAGVAHVRSFPIPRSGEANPLSAQVGLRFAIGFRNCPLPHVSAPCVKPTVFVRKRACDNSRMLNFGPNRSTAPP